MKRICLAACLMLAACAEAPVTPTHPAIVLITATPSPVGTATAEVLPFRDLSTQTATATAVPPSATPAPATATSRPAPAATRPANPAPTAAPAAATQPPAVQPTDVPAQPSAAPVVPPSAAQPASDVGTAEQAVIDFTNASRQQNGLGALARDEALMNVARSRSSDMVARGYFGHTDPATGQPLGKPLVLSLGYSLAGENIFWSGRGLDTFASSAVDWFMHDAPHRANILNPSFTAIGVGIVWNGQGWTLTQNFGGR